MIKKNILYIIAIGLIPIISIILFDLNCRNIENYLISENRILLLNFANILFTLLVCVVSYFVVTISKNRRNINRSIVKYILSINLLLLTVYLFFTAVLRYIPVLMIFTNNKSIYFLTIYIFSFITGLINLYNTKLDEV